MIFQTKINTKAEQYLKNKEGMLELLKKLDLHLEESRFQGAEKHIQRAKDKGKLLARERVELLLDQDSFFLELLPLVGLEGKGFGPGGTSVAGIGLVSGRLCMITSNVATNKGGAIDYATLRKSIRIGEIAMENGLPTINLVESAGANLPEQEKIFNFGGTTFRDITRRSKAGFPTISVVFGNATAGGAYVPGMSDYAIFVKDQAKIFLAGPPLVKMATKEVVDDENLGGAAMHSKISGVSDYLAEDEVDGIRIAREIVQFIRPADEMQPDKCVIVEPLYDPNDILEIISPDIKVPYDCRELITRIVDGSEFSEFKPEYGNTLVTGWAYINGYKIGIIGNNGVLFSESANKGAQFIQLCNQSNVPLLFLQNITGFMVGRKYEEEGIIKNGAKLINVVSNCETPTITIMVGSSYGAGNCAMNGQSYQPRFLFTYPNSKIAVMGPEQLASVMDIIQREASEKTGKPYDENQAKMMQQFMIMEAEKKSNAWFATSEQFDDGIINPVETHNYLKICMKVIHNKAFNASGKFGIFRM